MMTKAEIEDKIAAVRQEFELMSYRDMAELTKVEAAKFHQVVDTLLAIEISMKRRPR